MECSEEHPLVLVLDDLQWADDTSLKLIPLIVSGDARSASFPQFGRIANNLMLVALGFINTIQAHAVCGSI